MSLKKTRSIFYTSRKSNIYFKLNRGQVLLHCLLSSGQLDGVRRVQICLLLLQGTPAHQLGTVPRQSLQHPLPLQVRNT
ncbi:hypothetical protein HMI54_012469, partial [Coelomomyces lativittatus]